MSKLTLIATATFGLEAVVKREIEALGYPIVRSEDARILYTGDERALCRSNLWLRAADRVLVLVGEFEARSFEELFQQTKALPWADWIPADGFPEDDYGDYYMGDSYDGSWGGSDFTDSDVWEDLQDSDSDSDWDFDDTDYGDWDSGDTDWDSDW